MEAFIISVGDRLFTKDPIHLNDIQPVDNDTNIGKRAMSFYLDNSVDDNPISSKNPQNNMEKHW